MDLSAADPLRTLVGVLPTAAMAPGVGRRSWRPRSRLLARLLRARAHYLLAGAVAGFSTAAVLNPPFRIGTRALIYLLAAWSGLSFGLNLDLRAKRRPGRSSPLAEGLAAAAAALPVLVLAYVLCAILLGGRLRVEGALAVAGLSAAMLRTARPRQAPGSRAGGHARPLVAGCLGVGLVGLGRLSTQRQPVALGLPYGSSARVILAQSLGAVALWCLALGIAAGMVLDLASRGPQARQLPLLVVAALALGLGAGVGGGPDPVFIGLVAGCWWINCTLRRAEVLRALGKADPTIMAGLSCMAGWQLGDGAARVGLLPAVVAAVALLTGVVAPLGARAVAVLGRRWRGTGALWADVPERSFGPRALGGIGMGLAVCLPELLGDAIGPSVLGGLLAVHVLAAPGGEEPAPGARAG